MIDFLLYFFIFPGFLFLTVSGMFVSWIDRKISARIQWRIGPPLLQPLYDVIKLMYKESVIPDKGNTWVFVLSPLMAFFSIILISNLLIITWFNPYTGFVGDLIVLIYLMAMPSIASIMGASASNNPFASVGASREIKSILGYELPFILSIIVPIIKSKSVALGHIILSQQQAVSYIFNFSGFLAFFVAILCIQAKMGLIPFDTAEAETEIVSGNYIEYSGPFLALWKLSKMMMLIIGPLFIVALFWSGGSWFTIPIKYSIIILILFLIKNTNPRLRIDQSIRFFWEFLFLIASLAIVLAVLGY
ncbi:MAG: NADH-quinone oxidoreductase subunit H [Elusimicrobia bacterium]|nr:NADH-quinone oxidoreductase subunit H [Elusimicrobiota bacterium]